MGKLQLQRKIALHLTLKILVKMKHQVLNIWSVGLSRQELLTLFKGRCIFSRNSKLNVRDERILEDILLSCAMVISSDNLYAPRSVKCVSKIEHTYYSWKSVSNLICVHCGSIDIDNYLIKK